MGVRRLWLVFAVLLVPGGARAGDHNWDVFLAASFLHADGSTLNLAGGHVAVAVTLGKHPEGEAPPSHRDDFSFIVDLSAHYLGGDSADPEQIDTLCQTERTPPGSSPITCPAQADRLQLTLMAGPRWNILGGIGKDHKHMPFLHALVFGIVHRAGGTTIGGITSGAIAVGAGWDFAPGKKKTWAPRLQVDYIRPVSSSLGGGVGDGWRISGGVIYRSKPEKP